MPRLRSAEAAARSISGLLVDIFRASGRQRFSSSSSSEDFITDSTEETTSPTSESTTSETDSADENFEPRRRTPYRTRATDRNIRNRSRSAGRHSSPDTEQENESEEESEEARDDSGSTIMNSHDEDNDVQVIENVTPNSNVNARSTPSDSDSESNIVNRPKRRRTDNFATDDEDETKPGVSTETATTSAAVHADDDSGDDGCTICYEEYTSAGDHRLASVKCGHFFGYSCIARWIRSEGRNAVCPTCKAKATIKDVRKHYTNAVKVTDTTEVEMLRNSNAALHIKISGLEVELARKDRELTDLMKRMQEGKPHDIVNVAPQLVVQPRGGRMFMNPERKEALMNGTSNADARAMDFNGEFWAIGVACSQARNIFSPYGIRMLTITRQEFKLRECYPLHSGRSRVVVFSPFESSLLLSGGEDKRAIVSTNGAIRRQWKMPNEKPVWTGCWTAANKVALGLGDGRVFEYAVDSDSTEPIRDYTQGVGHLPIIFTGFDPASSTLLVASFKKLIAFRNEKVFPLLNNTDDQFDKMRSISFDESSLHFAVTFSPGGRHPAISHRLYRLEIDDDNDEVRCIEMAQWLTDCQMSSTMWSNCLFSLKNSLFSVVFNEDKQRFDAHDWSGRRTDAMIRYPSSATVATIRAIPSPCESRKTIVVLADKALFSIAFGLSDSIS
ncbi:zinc finger, C3HC4 type [Ancylostoma caninum]|uniref:RING-type E3 ubiquitin transferase n=1 Tax=Ancylostoma caninum TaxID=29170 RepID=A0A368H2E6_ANCCA|nr:zinc finger, C3HC4 type [Ancylostoma caninum]